MGGKHITMLAVILLFIGLFSLMSLHVLHQGGDGHQETDLGAYYHIVVGFPVSILGVMLLLLAERRKKQA